MATSGSRAHLITEAAAQFTRLGLPHACASAAPTTGWADNNGGPTSVAAHGLGVPRESRRKRDVRRIMSGGSMLCRRYAPIHRASDHRRRADLTTASGSLDSHYPQVGRGISQVPSVVMLYRSATSTHSMANALPGPVACGTTPWPPVPNQWVQKLEEASGGSLHLHRLLELDDPGSQLPGLLALAQRLQRCRHLDHLRGLQVPRGDQVLDRDAPGLAPGLPLDRVRIAVPRADPAGDGFAVSPGEANALADRRHGVGGEGRGDPRGFRVLVSVMCGDRPGRGGEGSRAGPLRFGPTTGTPGRPRSPQICRGAARGPRGRHGTLRRAFSGPTWGHPVRPWVRRPGWSTIRSTSRGRAAQDPCNRPRYTAKPPQKHRTPTRGGGPVPGATSSWWQVKDSNLRSFRDGFTVRSHWPLGQPAVARDGRIATDHDASRIGGPPRPDRAPAPTKERHGRLIVRRREQGRQAGGRQRAQPGREGDRPALRLQGRRRLDRVERRRRS